jgi:spermidine synthase
VLVQWFQLYEIDPSLVASVLAALGAEFPDYAVYAATNADLLIVAGDAATLARPLADVLAMPGVARELRRVYVTSIDDLRIRRIGGKAALAPLFASYGVPPNSDYRPYLDLHAAKYRFLQQSAGELVDLGLAAVPAVAMLEGAAELSTPSPTARGDDYLDKAEHIRRARYARDFLLRAVPPEPQGIPRQLQKDLELIHARLIECRDPEKYDIWLHALYQLARTLNPLLGADDSGAVWDRLEQAPCARALAPDQRAWIAMFRAVGRHDAAAMAQGAERLLAAPSDLPAGHREYLVAAGMAGYLAQGQHAKAAALWRRYPRELGGTDELTLRLLAAHALGK